MLRDIALLAAVFLGATLLALALGASNTGRAATFGQLAFVIALTALLVKRK